MKVIIAGSRTLTSKVQIFEIINKIVKDNKLNITEVVCGMANGVDYLGGLWAEENNIPVKEFPADWHKYGKRAGYLRNSQMAEYGEALIAISFNNSPGTRNMIELAEQKDLPIFKVDVQKIETFPMYREYRSPDI